MTTKTTKQAGWTKIRVTKLHTFTNARLGIATRAHWASRAIYTEGNRDWVCIRINNTWYRTDEYTYNGR